jgi:hypothetical protein
VQNRQSKLVICADAIIILWDGIGHTICRVLEPAIGREPWQYMDQGGRLEGAGGRGYLRCDPARPTARVWRTEQP